ncbi:T9SS type A sorting domain-containing protein [Epilithonimonas xixisoli]|uniref:Putative secreted protein (Por secretion system target) n=1 Tax=Epilithonimonas xixisoli TaxID=1476462 RepID=A0A4R8IKG6_9FLAO|nr:T9SS type A sorting domain-containing protein [Epilithonimonas xixisoli]TDX87159.1 putative secreted protein (Por secretion system target) [Epilithonimonas xixisoli]
MRKILLLSSIALTSILTSAQVFTDDNFNSANFTVGNIAPDFYPAEGQGGWQVSASAAIPNRNISNFQIVDMMGRKVATILGPDAATGTKFFLKESFESAWVNRTEFNDVIQAEFDFYTGAANAASTNRSQYRILTPNPTNPAQVVALAGFGMDHKDLTLYISGYSNPCNVIAGLCPIGNEYTNGNYSYSYTEKLPANTWLKIGVAWDYNTGEVFMKVINPATGTTIVDDFIPAALANAEISEIGFTNAGLTGGTVAATTYLGSVKIEARDGVELLAVGDIVATKASVSVYPNPTSDFLKFDTKSKVESVQVYDMAGKAVSVQVLNNQIDVRNLAVGSYVVKIQTAEGSSTQKFIKK